MKPSKKTDGMEAALTGIFGFDRRALIKANKCVPRPIGCGGDATQFRDEESMREYAISGLCQRCQDSVFGSGEANEGEGDYVPEQPPRTPPEPVLGPNDWISDSYQMFSGQAEAVERKYRLYPCTSNRKGVWLVADQPNAGENVYYHNPANDATSQGFGGNTLHFPLVDGGVYAAKGPWHGNTDSLFADTGVDLRATHYTFVVLGMSREYVGSGYGRTVIRDVVYKDTGPTLGRYDRYKDIIKAHPQAVVYYMCSRGGSSCGHISKQDRSGAKTTT